MLDRDRGRRRATVAVSLAAVAILALASAAAAQGPARAADAGGPGATAGRAETGGWADYDWRLTTLDGRSVSLEEYRGEVVVVNVWATWCAPCVRELESFAHLAQALGDVPVRLLFVSPEAADPVRRFVRRYRYGLSFLLEAEPMPDAFDLRALPTTYVIDREGRIVLEQRGAADWSAPPVLRYLTHLATR